MTLIGGVRWNGKPTIMLRFTKMSFMHNISFNVPSGVSFSLISSYASSFLYRAHVQSPRIAHPKGNVSCVFCCVCVKTFPWQELGEIHLQMQTIPINKQTSK